jgi:AcrR family transcriptional regulator
VATLDVATEKAMKSRTDAKNTRPPKAERDQLRRDQIVVAAQKCVVRQGFHAASLGAIAASAEMSVGQIYRYFANKEAIVNAIVESIVERRLRSVIDKPLRRINAIDMAKHLVQDVPEELRDDDILMLEATVEATRNPAVAQILRNADRRLLAHALTVFRRDHPGLDARDASARLEALVVLLEGSLYRRLTGRGRSDARIRGIYEAMIGQALSKSD